MNTGPGRFFIIDCLVEIRFFDIIYISHLDLVCRGMSQIMRGKVLLVQKNPGDTTYPALGMVVICTIDTCLGITVNV